MASRSLGCVLGIGIATLAARAHAQDTPPAADSPGELQEIVVTSQRRSEKLQSVPLSVTAVNADTLAASGVRQTSDLQILTPGLVWSTAISVPTPFIRGVGSRDNSAANENGVATYLDGIYYAAMPGGLLSLPNIQRVEVLKGPQGTLFGRNANGGLIQIITRDPPTTPSGKFSVSYGNYNTVTTSGYAGGPLSHGLSGDVSVYFNDQIDGWGRNLLNGAEVNLAKDLALRSKLLWSNDDDTRILLAGDYDHRRSDIGNSLNIFPGATASDGKCSLAPFPAGYPGCARQPSTRFRGSIYDSQSDLFGINGNNGGQAAGTEQAGASLTIEHSLSFATLRSLSSYRRLNSSVYVDQEGGPLPVSEVIWHQYDRTVTQELQLASAAQSDISWLAGVFYMNRKAGYDPFHVFGYSLGLASALDPVGRYGAPPGFGGGFDVFSNVRVNSYAGYGQATVGLPYDTNLTGGIRYTSDLQQLDARQVDARGVQRAAADPKKTFSKATYRLALDHHFTPATMAYASYNRGFKAGVFNTTNASGTVVNPETLDAFEVGEKADLLNRRLRLNMAAFHYNYKDLQLPIVVPGGTQTINAARAKINGLDVDLTALPLERLTLTLGGSFLFDAKYTSFPNGPSLTASTAGNTQVATNLSGNRMIRAPKFAGNASLDYTVPTSRGNFGLNLSYYHNSGFFWTPDDHFEQPAYDLVNTEVRWDAPVAPLTLRLWARNLLAQGYYNYVAPSVPGTVASPGEPRTYGVTAEYSF